MLARQYQTAALSLRLLLLSAVQDSLLPPCQLYSSLLRDSIHPNFRGDMLLADLLVYSLYLVSSGT
jgi:hypothetical protein